MRNRGTYPNIGSSMRRRVVLRAILGGIIIVLWASTAVVHAAAVRQPTRDEVRGADRVHLRMPSGGFFPWRFRINRRVVEVHVEGSLISSGSSAILLTAAIEGAGLLQLPLPYVAGELAAGRLVTVLDQYAPPPSEGFFLYCPSRRQTRAALKALVDFLRDARRGASNRAMQLSVTPLAL